MNVMKPTRVRDLAANAVGAAVLAWLATHWVYESFPPVTAVACASLYPVAVGEAALAFVIRARVRDHNVGPDPRQLHPITVARAAALAKASAQVGSLAAGVWLGFLLWVLSQRATLHAAAADTPGAFVGVGAGVALVIAALWLEYCCRAPVPPPDETATT